MPKRAEKRVNVLKSVKKDEPKTLACEWESCDVIIMNIDPYLDHITKHLQNVLQFVNSQKEKGLGYETGEESQFACYWRECSHDPFDEFSDLVRHVYFHSFHVKLKSIGMTMIMKNNMNQCMLDASTRNLIPDIPERFSCAWDSCKSIYDNPELFYMHINNHCDLYPVGNFVPGGCRCHWEGCGSIVKSKHKLKDHVRAHTQEKLAACPTCGTLFSNMTRLYDHLKRQAESHGHTYQCSHCSKKYSTERLLKEHMRHHVNHYQCPFCDMTCPNPSNLKLHFRYRHTDSRPYVCDECPHSAKSQNDMRRHQEVHKAWLHCDIDDCCYRCHSINELNRHFKLKHEYTEGKGQHRFQCHLCNSSYIVGAKLTNHLRKKHRFRWPPGHVRFRYKFHSDGFYRLQTVRYESIELTQQILASDITGEMGNPIVSTTTSNNSQSNQAEKNMTTSKERPHRNHKGGRSDENTDGNDGPEIICEDILISEDERADDTPGVNYSYNLDLLGDVALKGSDKKVEGNVTAVDISALKSKRRSRGQEDDGKRVSPMRISVIKSGNGSKEGMVKVNAIDIPPTTITVSPVKMKRCRKPPRKRKRLSMENESATETTLHVQSVADSPIKRTRVAQMRELCGMEFVGGNELAPTNQIRHSTPIKQCPELQHLMRPSDDLNESIQLPDGQQVALTSDLPVTIQIQPMVIPQAVQRSVSIENTQAQFEGLIPLESVNVSAAEIQRHHDGVLIELQPVEHVGHHLEQVPHVKNMRGTNFQDEFQNFAQNVNHVALEPVRQGGPPSPLMAGEECTIQLKMASNTFDPGTTIHITNTEDSNTGLDPEICDDLRAAVNDMDPNSPMP